MPLYSSMGDIIDIEIKGLDKAASDIAILYSVEYDLSNTKIS